MPKGSPELTAKRKNEIKDACAAVYQEQGFCGVNIKEISTAVSMTRPAIYHYFETKEEILLGLLVREYEEWLAELKKADLSVSGTRLAELKKADLSASHTRTEIIEMIASSLENREIMLRILNMNLMEIEINSRVDRLAEFKGWYKAEADCMKTMLRFCRPDISDAECEIFSRNLDAFLIGLYPFIHHTDKQIEAMMLAGVEHKKISVYDAVVEFLERVIPV